MATDPQASNTTPSADGQRPSSDIEVTLFRQILMVPFAIERPGVRDVSIADLRSSLAAVLAGAPEQWLEVREPLLHLPEDQAVAGLAGAARSHALVDAYEEFVYFEPYVQDFLFGAADGKKLPPLALWQRRLAGRIDITYDLGQPGPDQDAGTVRQERLATYRLSLDRCNLYLFSTGNAILAVELGLVGRVVAGDETAGIRLDEAQALLESVRRTFPPYFTRTGKPERPLEARYYPRRMTLPDPRAADGRAAVAYEVDPHRIIATVTGEGDAALPRVVPLFEPWQRLLAPLLVKGLHSADGAAGTPVLAQLGDDRAFVVAQLGVREPHAIGRGDWVRLCFLDSPGSGAPYGPEFLADFERRHCYDRFYSRAPDPWHTTRYLVCNYALVAVGAAPAAFEAHAGESFFRQVLGRHMRRQYFDIALIALLQRTALKTLSDRIADVETAEQEQFTALQAEVLDFTHRYWFEDISAQLQAQELFEHLRREMRLRDLYRQLSDEAREANALAAQKASQDELEKQGNLADAAQRLNVIAAVGLGASVIVGFFGMNIFEDGHEFLKANSDFVFGLSLVMAGFFATLFIWRQELVEWFATSCIARFAVAFIPLALGLTMLLALFSGE